TIANPKCKIPDVNDPAEHGGYGVFGAGLTGSMPIPDPILSLPGCLASSYSIALTRQSGELVIGGHGPRDAVQFPLTPGTNGARWAHGQACLFVDQAPIGSCLAISFDTGNGVPWIRDSAMVLGQIPSTGTVVQ